MSEGTSDGGSPRRAAAGRVWAGRLIRIGVAALPIAWLARKVDPAAAARLAGAIGWGPAAGAIGISVIGVVVGTARWAVLLRAYGAGRLPPFRRLLKNVFISAYFNILPSGLAGDVFRALRVKDALPDPGSDAGDPGSPVGGAALGTALGAALTVIAMERVVGLLALLAIVAAMALSGSGVGSGVAALAFRAACAAAALLSAGLVLVPWILSRRPRLRALAERVPLASRLIRHLAPPRRPGGVVTALALSLATQGLALLVAELLLYRVATPDQLLAALRTLPFAILLTYVPITPGAVAQREAVYTLFLGLAGISPDVAVAVAVLSFTTQLAVAAIGGLLYGAERLGWIGAE